MRTYVLVSKEALLAWKVLREALLELRACNAHRDRHPQEPTNAAPEAEAGEV